MAGASAGHESWRALMAEAGYTAAANLHKSFGEQGFIYRLLGVSFTLETRIGAALAAPEEARC